MDMLKLAELLETAAAALRRDAGRDTETAALPFDAPAEWQDWAGGDEPPADAVGKVVDIRLADGSHESGPAAAWSWAHEGEMGAAEARRIVAYRIADEQPGD